MTEEMGCALCGPCGVNEQESEVMEAEMLLRCVRCWCCSQNELNRVSLQRTSTYLMYLLHVFVCLDMNNDGQEPKLMLLSSALVGEVVVIHFASAAVAAAGHLCR